MGGNISYNTKRNRKRNVVYITDFIGRFCAATYCTPPVAPIFSVSSAQDAIVAEQLRQPQT